ncbi:hypothetical protein C8F01DRAFT_1229908, partial [Mycena amicta]
MAPPKKPPPPEFKENPVTKQVCCLICAEDHPNRLERWITRAAIKAHLTSATHLGHVDSIRQKEQDRLDRLNHLRGVYSGPDAQTTMPSVDASSHVRAGMFDTPPDNNDLIPPHLFATTGMLSEPAIDPGVQPLSHDADAERERLAEQLMKLLWEAEDLDEFGDRADEEDATAPAFGGDFDADGDEEDNVNHESTDQDPRCAPYPNRLHMLLDIIDNLPRLRLSTSHFNIILWLLKQCGVRNVPSVTSLRKTQTKLRALCGNEPQPYTSSVGNRFFVNDVRDSVAKDFANPEVAKHLNFYPEETAGPVSEVWQAQRWKEYAPSQLTPMFSRGHRQFYIDEVAELNTGEKVLPVAWIIRGGELWADYHDVLPETFGWTVGSERKKIPVSRLVYNYFDVIERVGDMIPWADSTTAPSMPNPLRELAEGEDLFVVMIPLWADDVSGNKSKQYNKHINVYMVNSNLPGQLLQQEYFVRFVSTSPNATSPEQFSALKEQIQATETEPIRCFNAHTQKPCRAILRVPGLPADNPQQSEECSHMGGNANRKCRVCKAGGNHEHTESDEGYHALHFAGVARTAAETKQTLLQQLDLAMYGIKAPIEKLQTATGVKDKVAQYWIEIILEKARKMKVDSPAKTPENIATELRAWLAEQPGDKTNPLLDISGKCAGGLDPNRDTPVEILHTILLGIIKYVWHLLHTTWSAKEQDLFSVRLQSTDTDGLTVPPIRAAYMMQYRNNLIGKHFKALMQTMVFHMHEITSPEQFALVKAVCALGPLLWVSEIDNMKEYTHDLTILIGNVLDAFGDTNPARIIQKVKIHLLPHIIDDAVRYGPPIRNSTEVFEGFNAVFRMCSILSNHQAPSRDIALKFASMDRLKHMLSGGYWQEGGQWVCAGPGVVEVLKTMPVIQRHLGWVPPKKIIAGFVRLPGRNKLILQPWSQTQSANATVCGVDPTLNLSQLRWNRGLTVTAQSGDACKEGSWICARETASPEMVYFGRILEILCSEDGRFRVVSFEKFLISECLHPQFDMPVLHRPDDEAEHRVCISASTILFRFSAQHDCRLTDCQPTASRLIIQERAATSRTMNLLEHADDSHFILNTAGLHNASLVRRVLPRALTVPRPIYTDRRAHHIEIAATLRISQKTRRAMTQEKRRNTLARKLLDLNGVVPLAPASADAPQEGIPDNAMEIDEIAGASGESDGEDSGLSGGEQESDAGDGDANEVTQNVQAKKRKRA